VIASVFVGLPFSTYGQQPAVPRRSNRLEQSVAAIGS
jgi:hypothetical protein